VYVTISWDYSDRSTPAPSFAAVETLTTNVTMGDVRDKTTTRANREIANLLDV
jgi:hypothetical protein